MTDPIPFYLAQQEFDPALPIGSLLEHPENYNRGDTEAIAESLDQHGFYGAVMVQKSTGYIIAGNHRYRSAVAKGAVALPAFLMDIDDDEARRIMAADNRTTHLATFDEGKLVALLTSVSQEPKGLAGTGYSMDAMDDLIALVRGAKVMEHHDGETSVNDGGKDNAAVQGGADSQRYEDRGLRDIILVMPNAEADRLAAAVVALRSRWGDMSQASVLLRAAETCAEMREG